MSWYEDDDFWATFAPAMFSDERWEKSATDVQRVLSLAGIEPDDAAPRVRVLDLCCGPGRHTLELCRLGFTVTGVDRTPRYLAEAHNRADALSLRCELVEADMRQFVRPESFDLAVNLFTSFGYFEKPADDRRVVENLYSSLACGGVLVMDMAAKEAFARKFAARDWRSLAVRRPRLRAVGCASLLGAVLFDHVGEIGLLSLFHPRHQPVPVIWASWSRTETCPCQLCTGSGYSGTSSVSDSLSTSVP
jgi:SAM-dependent methyltransferase